MLIKWNSPYYYCRDFVATVMLHKTTSYGEARLSIASTKDRQTLDIALSLMITGQYKIYVLFI